MLHGSLVVLSLLVRLAALAGRRLLHDARLCLDDARVAYVELLVRSVTLHFRDKEPLVDVLVAKVSTCCFVDVLFIVVVEIDSFVVYQVLRLLVLPICISVVLWLWRSPGLRVFLLDKFDLHFLDVTSCAWLLVETLILSFIVQATSLLKVVIMMILWLCSLLGLGLVALV